MMPYRVAFLSLCFFSASTALLKTNEIESTLYQDEGAVTEVKTSQENRYRRNLRPVEFDINGEKAKLNLVLSKRKVFSPSAPIWLVRSHQGHTPNYTYELLKNRKDILDGDFYVDNKNKAVILVRYDHEKNTMLYDGVFGEGSARRIIHSLSENSKVRSKRANDLNYNHIVYALLEVDELADSVFDTQQIVIERNGVLLDKLDVPLDTLYPKLLVVVDYHLFKLLGKDVTRTVRYVATFWNIVDQKYERLETPKVQVIVTGIVIVEDEKALNFIYRSRNETEKADIDQLMEYSRLYFSQDFVNDTSFKNYDAAILMTGLKMNLIEGFFEISGLAAKLGGICSRQYNVAIVTDSGAYRNTLIAIHELGHLLNLSHDFADECNGISYLFGSLKTTVMSSPTNGSEIFWSDCSLRLLKEFSTLKAAKCLATRHRTM
ncbi:venom metalloproteinase 3-like [Nasonia vitripennis]|uniref:Peptidase M12B domain-containing protein n=1 Tax=Nasonia vitripennis TaxID=7425 RepID=A0A7M7J0G0_NASVI|nr:venom metalloproteinase 3-like [Nasonia vitripennis]